MKIPTQYQLIMPTGQFKAMWQCSDATWWPTFKPMQVAPPHVQILNQCKLWWPNLQLMQVAPSGGQILQLIQMVVKFATNASGTIWWTNLQQMFNMLTLSQYC